MACNPGYYGPSCNITCPFGAYGKNCGGICACASDETCDPLNGCQQTPESINQTTYLYPGLSKDIRIFNNTTNTEKSKTLNITSHLLVGVGCIFLGFFLFFLFMKLVNILRSTEKKPDDTVRLGGNDFNEEFQTRNQQGNPYNHFSIYSTEPNQFYQHQEAEYNDITENIRMQEEIERMEISTICFPLSCEERDVV